MPDDIKPYPLQSKEFSWVFGRHGLSKFPEKCYNFLLIERRNFVLSVRFEADLQNSGNVLFHTLLDMKIL